MMCRAFTRMRFYCAETCCASGKPPSARQERALSIERREQEELLMKRTATMNMTEGRPLVLLSAFALPLLIGNVFQQAYNLADSMIVGRMLGANALAAVGATGSISFLFFSIFNGISGGCGIVTAQYFGAKQDQQVRSAIVNSAYITLASSLLTGLAAFLMVPTVLTWMGTPPEILPDAITYMRMTAVSVPLIAIYNYASSMQRALGDSRTPLYFLVVSCVLNIGLDILFIGTFHLGVFGAAFATMLAQLLAGFGSLLYAYRNNPYFRLRRRYLAPNPVILKEALRLGLPLALQWSLIAISTTALQTVVNSFGPTAVAAFTATNRLEQLVQQPYGSMSMALSTYAGQNMGAGKTDRIRMGFKDSLLAMLALAAGMTLIMQMFGENLVHLFVHETDAVYRYRSLDHLDDRGPDMGAVRHFLCGQVSVLEKENQTRRNRPFGYRRFLKNVWFSLVTRDRVPLRR